MMPPIAEKEVDVVLKLRDESAAQWQRSLSVQKAYAQKLRSELDALTKPAAPSPVAWGAASATLNPQHKQMQLQERTAAAEDHVRFLEWRQREDAIDQQNFQRWRQRTQQKQAMLAELQRYAQAQPEYRGGAGFVGGAGTVDRGAATQTMDVYAQSAIKIGIFMAAVRGLEQASKAATAAMRGDWEGLDSALGQIPFFGQGWQAGRALKQSFIDLHDAAKKYMYPWLRGIPTELQRLEGAMSAAAKATSRGAATLAAISGLRGMESEIDDAGRLRGKRGYDLEREQVQMREEKRLAELRAAMQADSRTMSASDAERLRLKIMKDSAEELRRIERDELDDYTKQRNAEREVARRVQAANREEWERGKQAAREYGSHLLSIEAQTQAKRLENNGKANEAKLVLMRDAHRRELEQAKSARERELLQARFGEEERALMLAGRGRGIGGRPAPVNAAVLSGRFWDSNVGTAMDPTVSAMREAASEAKETRKAVQKLPAEMVRALSMLLGQDVTFTLGMVN